MEVYFGRIQQTMDLPDLPSRLRFMLMDIVDLRKARWVSKEIAEPWFKQVGTYLSPVFLDTRVTRS